MANGNIRHVIKHQAVLPKLCKRISAGMEIGIDSIGAPTVVVVCVCEQKDADLLQVRRTCNAASFLPGRIQSRKKQSGENRDNSNRYKEFNQRKRFLLYDFHSSLLIVCFEVGLDVFMD